MFLKSLTVQGFKSFADRTTLEFNPGVSVIVGPNGSGKSNLSDAIAWVLGEQGPKTLRGGKMEDVIFAGTPKRPASGRAEVSLTIDNSSGALPIEFTEVTLTRTIFRGGESEYAINGVPCRLLDLQELLSDSGIGRELHTIVGQGQLDQVLTARPEERRAYIEEAAGILKFRRRKERAVRKLERTDSDLERLGDVISELRRQIRPLEQQAETAKRSAEIQAELAEVTLKLWACEYRAVSSEGDRETEARLVAEIETLSEKVQALDARVESLEAETVTVAGEAEAALSSEYRLASVRERVGGLARLAEERSRHLEELAMRAPEGQAPPPEAISAAQADHASIAAERAEAELSARAAEKEWLEQVAAQEAAVRAREEIVHLQGERAALRAAVQSAEEERQRLVERRAFLARRRSTRSDEIERTAAEIRALDERETEIEAALERARSASNGAQAASNRAAAAVRESERSLDALQTTRRVLAAEAAKGTPADLIGSLPGLVSVLRGSVRAVAGFERALHAALEPIAGAIIAARGEDAMAAIKHLRGSGRRATFIVPFDGPAPPAGVPTAAGACASGPEAVRTLLGRIALADTLADAWDLVRATPGLVAVTLEGDRAGGGIVAGGDASALERDIASEISAVEAEITLAEEHLVSARYEAERTSSAAVQADRELEQLSRLANEIDAELTGVADHLAELEREDHTAQREDAMMSGRLQEVEERHAADAERLSAVEAHLSRAVAEEVPVVDGAQLAAADRRAAERSLVLGGLAERERAAAARVAELTERARRIAEERETWERSREARLASARRAAAVGTAAHALRDRIDAWVEQSRRVRFAAEERRTKLAAELAEARRGRREAGAQLEETRTLAHASDLARAERAMRLTAMVERLRAEHSLSPEEALARVPAEGQDVEELRRRANVLDRKLGLIGRVNPIAMEQYESMVARHAFLVEQADDLKKSRRDLVSVVEEVDAKIVELFTEAFADVVTQFESVFTRLFPGGEGKIMLTEPDDLLNSGVDVEARPGGKRVKRISLLSGGERALTAIALLCAIFRARPSPFYLMDEVEAALDDVNLHRFLELVREFKDASQILIVTHQKRTMEVADILYGISMGPDGVTKVLSQRLEEPSTIA